MATNTFAKLDKISRATITRFVLKLAISFLIARLVEGDYAVLVSSWLAFYALFAAITALMFKQKVADSSFNGWDEASWLIFIAAGIDAFPGLVG